MRPLPTGLLLATGARALSSAAQPKPKTVILVRHGAVDYLAAGLRKGALYGGDIDVPLSDRGEAEAVSAAAYVSENFGAPDCIFASPLKRAVWGAERISEATGGCEVQTDVAFKEVGRGEWLRKTLPEIEDCWPGGMAKFLADAEYRPPGGESVSDVAQRVRACLQERVLPAVKPGGCGVVVSHLYVTRAMLAMALDCPIADIDVPTASVSALEFDGNGGVRVLCQGVKPVLAPEDEARLAKGSAET
ncbi:histidine phosphatase superfamily [Pelagophyceae sp. CCMP2097]|nr:histidine phosphatase superfamily [Pelagophyceae sp. CCMP2097]|mmetsp:Transcript_20350/g.68997  ORF Transcript_20350/g.68997 Transcript_20350/m.68997 type:complete len:247 (-) Transcript_20350:90-830(-)